MLIGLNKNFFSRLCFLLMFIAPLFIPNQVIFLSLMVTIFPVLIVTEYYSLLSQISITRH